MTQFQVSAPVVDFPDFRERFPWIGGDLQTAGDFLFVPPSEIPSARAERIAVPMQDGTGDILLGAVDHPAEPRDGAPLAVVLHGLTGCEDSKYVRRTAARLLGAGYPVLRLNLRGAGPSLGKTREQYHSGRSEDLRRVLAWLERDGRFETFVLVGFSLGGNISLKGLAEFGRDFPVRAGVSISAPIDLAATARRFLAPRNALYHHWLMKRMRREALCLPADAIPKAQREAVRRARTVVEFDDVLTAPRNGFADAWDYYERNAAIRFLDAVPVPTLLVHALNDPWIPGSIYARFAWERNPMLLPLLPERGGHVGFHEPGGGSWADRCLLLFLDRL